MNIPIDRAGIYPRLARSLIPTDHYEQSVLGTEMMGHRKEPSGSVETNSVLMRLGHIIVVLHRECTGSNQAVLGRDRKRADSL